VKMAFDNDMVVAAVDPGGALQHGLMSLFS